MQPRRVTHLIHRPKEHYLSTKEPYIYNKRALSLRQKSLISEGVLGYAVILYKFFVALWLLSTISPQTSPISQKSPISLQMNGGRFCGDIGLLGGGVGLFCGNTRLFCGEIGLFCAEIRLFCREIRLFCGDTMIFFGDTGLFWRDIPSDIDSKCLQYISAKNEIWGGYDY